MSNATVWMRKALNKERMDSPGLECEKGKRAGERHNEEEIRDGVDCLRGGVRRAPGSG